MLPSSHPAPTIPLPELAVPPDARTLADAFSHFIEAAGRLEGSYRELQREVAELGLELASRNRELEESLAVNQSMRLALVELLDALPCGVVALHTPRAGSEPAIPLRMNPEAARLLGVEGRGPQSLQSIAARTGVNLLPFCALEGESKLVVRAPEADGRQPENREPREPNENETGRAERWIAVRARRLPGAPGGMEVVLILSDISAQKQAEEERDAGRRAMALAEVASTLAHEVRNPLGSLELFASLLEDDPAQSARWLSHLRAGLRTLNGTVSNVLAFHGQGQIQLEPLVLGEVLAAIAEFVHPIAEQSHLLLICSGCEERGRVLAHPSSLQQLVLNLVTNAVRHTPPGGTVGLHLTRCSSPDASGPAAAERQERLRLTVKDTGCGIAPTDLPHIFSAGWSRAGESSGLGLAVCQRIAEQHGTTLSVASTPGAGTTFSLEFDLL